MLEALHPFYVKNLGCKVNRVESDAIAAQLASFGATPVSQEAAQLVVVNTCTVTSEADGKTRKAVRHALRQPAAPTVIVTGCAAAIDPAGLAALGDRVIVEPDRARVAAAAAKVLGVDPGQAGSTDPSRVGEGYPTRVGIKVQDGCDNACTYCIVHVARGRATSRPLAEVVAEVDEAARLGAREVVLTGINLGRYGDSGTRADLAGLIEAVLGQTPVERIRLSSVEPPEVTGRLLQAMAEGGARVAAHLHVPLQSGCEKTLCEMGRHGSAAQFARMLDEARRMVPGIAITTDVIAGFPGETDADFEESRAFCAQAGFAKMHVFRYSRRAGTPAAARQDQVPAVIAAERASVLRALSDEMRLADARARVGADELVLIERAGEGTSGSYHRVVVREGNPVQGALVPVRLAAALDDATLLGVLQ